MRNREEIKNSSKGVREVYFLLGVSENKKRGEIEKEYLELNLSERSNKINLRIFERLLGVYSKYGEEKKKKRIEDLKEFIVSEKLSINYGDLMEKLKIVKEKIKRSNRLNEFEIKV